MTITGIVNEANGIRITYLNGDVDQLVWILKNGQYVLSKDGVNAISFSYVTNVLNSITTHQPTKTLMSTLSGFNREQIGFNNNGTVWNDLRVPVTSTQAIGVNAPTFAFFRNNGGPASGQAATFGSSQQISSIPYNAKQDFPNSFSIGFWVKPFLGGGFGSLSRYIMERNNHFEIITDDDLFVRFVVEGVGTVQSSDDVLQADTWNYVTCICNVDGGSTTLNIKVNNQDVANTLFGSTPTTSDNAIVVGTRVGGNRWLNGDIDELTFFSKALNDAEVTNYYASGSGRVLEGDEDGLVGLYHFDGTANDDSDGTAVNMNYINPIYVEDAAAGGTGSTGTRLYGFVSGQTQELFFSLQLDHGVKPNSILKSHVHWTTAEELGNSKVMWGLEYTIAEVSGRFENTVTLTNNELEFLVSPNQYRHLITSLGDIPTVSSNTSTMIHGRIFRDGANVNDTFDGIAYLQEIDLHAEFDIIGTPLEFTRS